MSNLTASTAALRQEIWQKELYQDVIDNLYFTKNNMMGTGPNYIVELKDELAKEKGDTITFGLTAKLSGSGITGDNELEGHEESISSYSEQVAIDQIRNAVRLTGLLDEQMNAYDMRSDAKDKISNWLQEFIEQQIFLKLGGVNITTLTDIAGTVVGARALWSNTPDQVPTADSGNGYGARYLCADYTNGLDGLGATELITPALISRIKAKAVTASPKVLPLKINGKNYYVLFVHPYQAYDLKNNAVWSQAQREVGERGNENPIFSGALGIWDGVIIHEHEYTPWLDVSVVGYNFELASSGTQAVVDVARAILCGKQAIGFAKCKTNSAWVEKTFDYDNQTGFSTRLIGGIQKILFNSKNYGCLQLDTAVTSLV